MLFSCGTAFGGAGATYYLRAYDTMVNGKRVPGWPGLRSWDGKDLDATRAREKECDITTTGIPAREPGWWEFPDRVSLSCITMARGDKPITLDLQGMKIGLYTFNIFGFIDDKGRKKLERVWQPCPMEFEVKDAKGKVVTKGLRLLKPQKSVS